MVNTLPIVTVHSTLSSDLVLRTLSACLTALLACHSARKPAEGTVNQQAGSEGTVVRSASSTKLIFMHL